MFITETEIARRKQFEEQLREKRNAAPKKKEREISPIVLKPSDSEGETKQGKPSNNSDVVYM